MPPLELSLHTLTHLLGRLRNRHFLFFDIIAFTCAPLFALYLRIDDVTSLGRYATSLLLYIVAALMIRTAIFYHTGMYRRFWRFAGIVELSQIFIAILLGTLTLIVSFFLARATLTWFVLPRSMLVIEMMVGFLLVGGTRATLRLTDRWQVRIAATDRADRPPLNIVLTGAGYTGAMLAREIQNHRIHVNLIGFIDDDPAKQGMQLYGIPVLGTRRQLAKILRTHKIERVLIAMPSAPGAVLRDIVAICRRVGVATQTMPGLHELVNGSVSINRLRNVQIEDLLRRTPIQTDTAAVNELLQGKRVLVTGGGGSIGSELCRQILRFRPAQLILVGHGENSVFEIANELRNIQTDIATTITVGTQQTEIIPVIADLRFRQRILSIFEQHRPEAVFHAAAHKHVPLMEAHPVEAITNNVLGTQILLEAAQRIDVERFVMISSDKAVNPTNVMGASKRTAELLVLEAARKTNRFYQVVRFGNVLGSRGSVIHTFKKQIQNGGPITVTHPEMVRYFMTIPEAVQLVLQAAVIGHGGEVLMLDMGDPVRIIDLAHDVIELSGLRPGSDIEIEFTGLRPGEKLFEEMFTPNESYRRTEHEKVLVAHNASQFVPPRLNQQITQLIAAALDNQNEMVFQLLHQLLPEYKLWQAETATTAAATGAPEPSGRKRQPLALQPVLSH
ncbi:MAG: nucleoside-diphosphate sugar epimerase/dehydratase [Caldilineaceae bacterium]